MNEPFDLPVIYKNQQLYLKAQLLLLGYTHKFRVEVIGEDILFEPDEERIYRAVIAYERFQAEKLFDKDLLSAIAEAIESLIKH
jgi:hypothetical protein